MKTLMAVSAMCLLAASASPAAAMNASEKQIEALEARFTAAFNAKDVDAIMKAYVPDDSLFVYDVVPPRQYVGWKAYRKDWQGFLATFKGPIKVELKDLSVTAEGNIGYSHCVQHVSGTDTKGKPQDFTVRVTDVYRMIKGSWYIVQEHVSVPVDVDTGKPDFNSRL